MPTTEARKRSRKNYRSNNRDKINLLKKKAYSRKNPATPRKEEYSNLPKNSPELRRAYRIRNAYNLSINQYDEMLNLQGNVCYVCRCPETRKNKDGTISPLAIDHDHGTGKVRKLLCSACNIALGKARDSIPILQSLIYYLMEHSDE